MTIDLLIRPSVSSRLGFRTRREPALGPVSRRRFLNGAAGGALLLGLSACGDDDSDDESDDARSAAAPPSRVVALGQGPDADTLITLGITPVAMSAAFTGDVYPWTAEALGSRSVEVVQTTDSIPIEQIAAYRPDLIVATTLYDFERFRGPLEQIATVIGPTATADQESWQQTTTRVGEAVGRADEARKLVEDTDAKLASVRDAHSDWVGRTFAFGPVTPGEQLYTVSSTKDMSAALLEQLGLVLSPSVTALPESEVPGRANLSLEQLRVLDADALLLTYFGDGGRAEFEAQPLFQQLDAVKRGSYVALEPDVAIGLAYPSVLSIPYSVVRLTPLLETALDTR